MVVIDPQADYLGLWNKLEQKSSEDWGIFLLWSQEGFSIDEFGRAKIINFKISETKVSFRKKYCEKSVKEGAIKTMRYSGTEAGPDYMGEWKGGEYSGLFILTKAENLGITTLGSKIMFCELEILQKKIGTKRREFPYLALREINF